MSADASADGVDAGPDSSEDADSPDHSPGSGEESDTRADAGTQRPTVTPGNTGSGVTDAGGGRDTATADSSSPAAHDASILLDAGRPDATIPWRPPAVSQVHMTGNSCLAVSLPANGKCGGYYCGVSEAALALEIDPGKPCGNIPAYVCTGELEAIATACSTQAQTENITALVGGNTTAFTEDLNTCMESNARVMNAGVHKLCLSCFANAHVCCALTTDCALACLGEVGGEECVQAMKVAGCMSPLFACGGLPYPF